MSASRKKRARGRPKAFDRGLTLERAMEAYWTEGPAGLSVNEVCRRCAVSKPALYREFHSEDGLTDAVLEHYVEQVVAPALAQLETDRPFATLLEAQLEWLTGDRGLPVGCLLAKMRSSPARLGPATTARVNALADEIRRAYAARYARALARGEANPAIPPELAGYFLDTQITNVLHQMALGEDPALVRAQARLAFASLLPSGQGSTASD